MNLLPYCYAWWGGLTGLGFSFRLLGDKLEDVDTKKIQMSDQQGNSVLKPSCYQELYSQHLLIHQPMNLQPQYYQWYPVWMNHHLTLFPMAIMVGI